MYCIVHTTQPTCVPGERISLELSSETYNKMTCRVSSWLLWAAAEEIDVKLRSQNGPGCKQYGCWPPRCSRARIQAIILAGDAQDETMASAMDGFW